MLDTFENGQARVAICKKKKSSGDFALKEKKKKKRRKKISQNIYV